MPKTPEILKPRAHLLHELTFSLHVIKDALDACKSGRRHHVLPLAGQIRALLLERARNAVKPPLLLSMAQGANVPLEVYAFDRPSDTSGLVPGYVYQYIPSMISYRRFSKMQLSMHIDKALDIGCIETDGRWLSLRELVCLFANQAGGAHFQRRIDRDLFRILMGTPSALDVVGRSLCDAGAVALEIGCAVLRKVVTQTLYMLVSIPTQELNEPCPIFDMACPESAMRMALLLTPENYLKLRYSGLYG